MVTAQPGQDGMGTGLSGPHETRASAPPEAGVCLLTRSR